MPFCPLSFVLKHYVKYVKNNYLPPLLIFVFISVGAGVFLSLFLKKGVQILNFFSSES